MRKMALLLAAVLVAAVASADGPYPSPSPKPKAKRMARPTPAPTPEPAVELYDGGEGHVPLAPAPEAEPAVVDTPPAPPEPAPAPPAERAACPPDQVCTTKVSLLAGGNVSMTSGESGVTPFFRANVELPLWQRTMATRLLFELNIQGAPGASITTLDPTTFTTVAAKVGLSQRFAPVLNFSAFVQAGFDTRMGTDPAPLVKTVRYGKVGLRVGEYNEGYLEVSLNWDQRISIDGTYLMAASMGGALKLHEQDAGQPLPGANVQLLGEAVLGLQQQYVNIGGRYAAKPQGNYITLAVAVGR